MATDQGHDRIDSLMHALPKAKQDIAKVKLLIHLSRTTTTTNPN